MTRKSNAAVGGLAPKPAHAPHYPRACPSAPRATALPAALGTPRRARSGRTAALFPGIAREAPRSQPVRRRARSPCGRRPSAPPPEFSALSLDVARDGGPKARRPSESIGAACSVATAALASSLLKQPLPPPPAAAAVLELLPAGAAVVRGGTTGPDLLIGKASRKLPTAAPMPPLAPAGLKAARSMPMPPRGRRANSARGNDLMFFHCFRTGSFAVRAPRPCPECSSVQPALAPSESLNCAKRGQPAPEASLCETLPRDTCSPHESEPGSWDESIRSDAVPVLCSLIGDGRCHGEELRPAQA